MSVIGGRNAVNASRRIGVTLSVCAAAVALGETAEGHPGVAAPRAVFERWTEVRPGVRHLERRDGPFAYHVVTVDLGTEGLEIRATDEQDALPNPRAANGRGGHRWSRTSTWARRVGADIAINGNYYDLTRWRSACGLAMSDGRRWASTYDDRRLDCFASAGFGDGGRASMFDARGLRKRGPIADWMRVVVSGSPALVREGEVLPVRFPRHALARNPRTAIGLSKDGRTLLLMVVDGREGSAQGMTCRESARVLRALGAWNAINLDGGGSSALYLASAGGVVNHTGEPERPVVNHLGIFFRPRGERAASTASGAPEHRFGASATGRDDADAPGAVTASLQEDPSRDPRRAAPWTTLGSFVSLGVVRVFRRRRDRRSLPITLSLG
jgi:hypothetical protein